ncbi:MAG: thioether cross-link-forming SCIFF peptide maturase, partial [Clostridia bacterium]|nr:thioether cross-link-forming SCIFF peptide maturase [Clostridia bacterium]
YYSGNNYYFVFHPLSSSLHSVDYAAFLVIKNKYEQLTDQERIDYLNLDRNIVAEIEGEISLMEEGGSLAADETMDYKKSNIVKALCLHICHDCNLACVYCFAKEGTYNTERDYMSLEVGKKAVDFLIKMSGTRHNLEIDFFGGEPLLNMDVVKAIVDYAKQQAAIFNKEFSFTTTTNGVLLNDDNIAYLNREMDNVVISIDGRREVHNAVRKTRNGRDCYELILDNAKKFRAVRGDKKYYIRGTFTANNLDFAKDALSLNDCGFDQISIEPVVLDIEDKLAIKAEHIEQILEEYAILATEYIERRKSGKWFNFFHFMIDLETSPCIKKRLSGCGAGSEYLAVSPIGEIFPCHQFVGREEYRMGSVLNGEFNKEIQNTFADITVYKKKDCAECFAKYYCSGGCIAASMNYQKDLLTPYKPACDMMRKRLELSLAIYAIEKTQNYYQ